jgi:pimeloyl-ACP methyl ester carboxylesterase
MQGKSSSLGSKTSSEERIDSRPRISNKPVQYITLSDGRKLGYTEYGDPQGKPLLYCHGGLCSRLDAVFFNDLCEQRGVRLIAPDRPGIGTSERKPNRSVLDWADDVAELLDQLTIDKFSLLGWSLGGPYALVCAYKFPDRLVAAGTSGSMAPLTFPGAIDEMELEVDRTILHWPRNLRWFLSKGLAAMTLMPPKLLKREVLRELSAPDDLEFINSLAPEKATASLYESMKQGAEGNLDDYWATADPWGFQLQDITIPFILWHGEDDKICPISHAKYLEEHIPHAELRVIPGKGHFQLHAIMPQVLDELVR